MENFERINDKNSAESHSYDMVIGFNRKYYQISISMK